ncbi:UNVERIFIED_CONTAM: hypothetical protein Slati_3941700 [Sesamum latifolium]|uniref:Uncharacterized protein n=1 Tax=Sesamum latifolium TaxID=2727402 RepID=A0AAW2TPV9_9LAMI
MRWCGDTSPPMAVSEAGAIGAPTLLVREHEDHTSWWDCDDESMFRVFHMFVGKYIRKTFSVTWSNLVKPLWLANDIWLQLQAYWASEGFQQESSKNKANREANPTASSTVYRGGSSSVGVHKRKLEAELGRPPKQMEVFERYYKKKEDGGWSGPRAAEVAETFQKLMEDHQPQPTADDGHSLAESEASVAITEQQMWLAAVGGKNKGRVFGIGSEAHFSSWTYTSPSPLPPPNPAQEDRIGSLEVMMASIGGQSQPTASSTAPAQPPIDPKPPNDDEIGGLD